MRTFSLSTCLAILMIVTPLSLPAAETSSTLEVTGRGAVTAMPDLAILTFAVETSAAAADEAIGRNAALADKLVDALKRQMGPNDRIATTQFQFYPVYDAQSRISPNSYRVTNNVRLETAKVSELGALIDAAAAAGSNRIGRLRFSHTQMDELGRQAAALAVKDARRIADELARAAGVTITRVRRIRYATAPPAPGPHMAEMSMAARSTPIEAGDLEIARQVTVIYTVE
jgi:uncharacterized protein YggE